MLPLKTWVCPSEDLLWRHCCCLDHGIPGNARYPGYLVATGTSGLALLDFLSLLASLPKEGLSVEVAQLPTPWGPWQC